VGAVTHGWTDFLNAVVCDEQLLTYLVKWYVLIPPTGHRPVVALHRGAPGLILIKILWLAFILGLCVSVGVTFFSHTVKCISQTNNLHVYCIVLVYAFQLS